MRYIDIRDHGIGAGKYRIGSTIDIGDINRGTNKFLLIKRKIYSSGGLYSFWPVAKNYNARRVAYKGEKTGGTRFLVVFDYNTNQIFNVEGSYDKVTILDDGRCLVWLYYSSMTNNDVKFYSATGTLLWTYSWPSWYSSVSVTDVLFSKEKQQFYILHTINSNSNTRTLIIDLNGRVISESSDITYPPDHSYIYVGDSYLYKIETLYRTQMNDYHVTLYRYDQQKRQIASANFIFPNYGRTPTFYLRYVNGNYYIVSEREDLVTDVLRFNGSDLSKIFLTGNYGKLIWPPVNNSKFNNQIVFHDRDADRNVDDFVFYDALTGTKIMTEKKVTGEESFLIDSRITTYFNYDDNLAILKVTYIDDDGRDNYGNYGSVILERLERFITILK